MVLVDTSVWIDHLRRGNSRLIGLLESGDVLCHSWVIGELACGSLGNRTEILALLAALPQAEQATLDDLLSFMHAGRLPGQGIGLVDTHLLWASRRATCMLWTHDKSLRRVAGRLGLAYEKN